MSGLPLFEIEGLRAATAEGGAEILKGIDLTVRAGEIHALMGPNGSGKSTLANVLLGSPEYALVAGSIRLKGEDITDWPPDVRAKAGLFLAFQHPKEIPGVSVRNFLTQALQARKGTDVSSIETYMTMKEWMERLEMDPSFMAASNSGLGSGSGANGAGAWRLDGTKMYVLDGHTADLLVVAARTGSGVSLFTVEADAAGLTRTPLSTMDQTRKQAKLTFDGVEAALLGAEGGGWPVLERVLDLAAVALAAEQVGGAQMCLDMAVEYAKVRVQFGRPIGSFQAIKHKCADMLLQVESAKSAAYYAGWCAAEMNDELPQVASMAKSYCSEAYFHAAAENIQIHGGIGFTWEHPAHLYFKRAKSSELLFGDPTYHRELLAQRIGI